MNAFKQQLNLFYLALSFFSRLPVPKHIEYSAELLNKSNRYFSLVGILLAAILILSYQLLSMVLPISITVLLVMIISLLLTGAFHEDGIADMADGIGGGMTIEKRLAIMKDSRLGTYGTATLISVLALKYVLLIEIATQGLFVFSILLGYSLSRATAISLISSMDYVNDADLSKSKPIAQHLGETELFIVLAIGCLPLLSFDFITCGIILLCLLIFREGFKRWLNARIGGYNGDCLGAAQQITELLIYLSILICNSNNLITEPLI